MDELLAELQNLGLSEKEAAVYLACLERGCAPVQEIARQAKINRATTYVLVESLLGRGLLSTCLRGKKRVYTPEAPDRLLALVRLQKKTLEEKEQQLEKALPTLFALYHAQGNKPQIRYLEGEHGLATARQIFERLDGEIVQMLALDEVVGSRELEVGRDAHFSSLHHARAEHRVLAVTEKTDPTAFPFSFGKGEVRLLSPQTFPMHGEITVRGSHVFLFSYTSTILSVVIVSKEIADAVRALFELAWKGSEGSPAVQMSGE